MAELTLSLSLILIVFYFSPPLLLHSNVEIIYGGAMLRAIYPFYNAPTQEKPLVHSITAAAHKDSVFFFSAFTANFSKVTMLPHVWLKYF